MATIISNNVTETHGINMESIAEVTERIKEDGNDTSEDSSLIKEDLSIISDEYFEKTCEEIKTMNFIEIKKFLQELKNQKQQLSDAKETAEAVMQMKESINVSDGTGELSLEDQIELADSEAQTGVDDIETFLNQYEDTMTKMDQLIEQTEEKVHEFDSVKKTTTFLTNAMLQVLDKNIERMNNSGLLNLKQLRNYYSEVRKIFSDRRSVEFLEKKILEKSISLRRITMEIRKDRNGSYLKSVQKNVTSAFCNVFNVNQMVAFEDYIKDVFQDDDITFYFQYALYTIYVNEKNNGKYGKHKWVEVLIMNILDISTGLYDLEGGEEYYKEQLLKLKNATIAALDK